MLCDAPLADTEHGGDGDDWCDFSSSQVLTSDVAAPASLYNSGFHSDKTPTSSSLDRLSNESFKLSSAESLEDLVSSFDKVVAKCLRTSISLDGIVPPPRIRHLDDLVEEECGNSYFSAFLTPNYLERLANVKWSECRTRALFVDSMHRLPKEDTANISSCNENVAEKRTRVKARRTKLREDGDSRCSSVDDDVSETSDSPPSSLNAAEAPNDGDLHALMVTSVAEADFNEPQPIVTADDVINEIEEMMRAQEEGDGDNGFDGETFFSGSSEIAMIDDAAATVDSGYDISMTSSALSVLPADDSSLANNRLLIGSNVCTAKLKPLPINSSGIQCCSGVSAGGKFVAQSPQHSDEDVVQLFLAESLEDMSIQELEKHAERLEVAIRKYSDVLVEELAARDEQVDLKETRDHFVGLVMSVQRRVRELSSSSSSHNLAAAKKAPPSGTSSNDPSPGKKRNSPFVTTVIPYNPDAGPLPLEELRVLAKILQAMLDDSPAVPTLLTEYILTVLCAKENPRV